MNIERLEELLRGKDYTSTELRETFPKIDFKTIEEDARTLFFNAPTEEAAIFGQYRFTGKKYGETSRKTKRVHEVSGRFYVAILINSDMVCIEIEAHNYIDELFRWGIPMYSIISVSRYNPDFVLNKETTLEKTHDVL